MSGRPTICPHCGYANYAPYHLIRNEKGERRNQDECQRCVKSMTLQPDDDGMETVSINGRMVRRKKQ